MSLPHALLTALIERPGSGLELARRFDKSIGHFWSASHQQIYRELAKLEADGLIRSEAEAEARGRKRVYEVLPAGREALIGWLGEDDSAPSLRDSLMVRLRAAAAVGPHDLAGTIEHRLAGHRQKLLEYEAFRERDFRTPSRGRSDDLHRLILLAGIRHEEHWIAVLTEALGLLEGS